MTISLRRIRLRDKKYFAKWWRDKDLLRLTSGNLRLISDRRLDKYFQTILGCKKDHHFMIVKNSETIGHLSLSRRQNNWYETQVIIGEREYWNKGYGARAICLLIKKAKHLGISKIYLEVRPDNLRAIKAYQKCGFQAVDIKKYPQNKYLPQTIRMELVKNKTILV